jgi:urease accessory protein
MDLLVLTQRSPAHPDCSVCCTLELTAEERGRSRHYFEAEGKSLSLQLPRGTVLHHNDVLISEAGDRVRVKAKAEPVITVVADAPLTLLRAAYHLGNRHVPLEVTETYLRLSPDPVLREMLEHLGVQVTEEVVAFYPEMGAYGHAHQAVSHLEQP